MASSRVCLSKHAKTIAFLYIIIGGATLVLGCLTILFSITGGLALMFQEGASRGIGAFIAEFGLLIGVILAICGLPELLAGYGIFKRAIWGSILGIIVSILYVPGFPVGTLLGVYGIWALVFAEDKEELISAPSRPAHGQRSMMPRLALAFLFLATLAATAYIIFDVDGSTRLHDFLSQLQLHPNAEITDKDLQTTREESREEGSRIGRSGAVLSQLGSQSTTPPQRASTPADGMLSEPHQAFSIPKNPLPTSTLSMSNFQAIESTKPEALATLSSKGGSSEEGGAVYDFSLLNEEGGAVYDFSLLNEEGRAVYDFSLLREEGGAVYDFSLLYEGGAREGSGTVYDFSLPNLGISPTTLPGMPMPSSPALQRLLPITISLPTSLRRSKTHVLYSYVDDTGRIHAVDNLDRVPARYRDGVREYR